MSKWNTEKQFSSFLGLSPDNRISGGKVLRCRTRSATDRRKEPIPEGLDARILLGAVG
jgi:hypothetical protein